MVAQSLRTAEPLHEVLPQTLLERLFYHQQHALDQVNEPLTIEHLKTLDYMYYASGVVAVYQLLHVSLSSYLRCCAASHGFLPGVGRGAKDLQGPVRRGAATWLQQVEAPV